MNKRKTHEEFVGEMAEKLPEVEVLGTYESAQTPVAVRCRTCGHEWSSRPSNFIRGYGCPKCVRAKTRKTHERFVEELAEKSPLIEILSPYETAVKPVAVRCRTCGHEWSARPDNLLSGQGCPKCARARMKSLKTKTHAQFVAELIEANPDIEVVGAYVNSKTPVDVRCRTCSHEWSPLAGSLLSGHGCPKCARANRHRTHAQFVAEMAEKLPEVEVVGTYQLSARPVAVRCRICGHEWSAAPSNLLNGHGCPKCARVRAAEGLRKTHTQFVAEMAEKLPEVEVVGRYEWCNTPVAVRCRICGHEWSAWPSGLLSGRGCSECAKARQRERGMEARIRRMAADGLVSEEDIALLRGWGFPFSDDELEKGRR